MIVVTVELWPHGLKDRAVKLGRAEIFNDGTGTPARGNYGVRLYSEERIDSGDVPPFYPGEKTQSVLRIGHVKNYLRLKLGVWPLVYRAVRDALVSSASAENLNAA